VKIAKFRRKIVAKRKDFFEIFLEILPAVTKNLKAPLFSLEHTVKQEGFSRLTC